MNLTEKEIKTICDLLGQVAINEAEKGNSKAEKRVFELIAKLENINKGGS